MCGQEENGSTARANHEIAEFSPPGKSGETNCIYTQLLCVLSGLSRICMAMNWPRFITLETRWEKTQGNTIKDSTFARH